MTPRRTLAHQLKVQFALPPDRPTEAELDLIVEDIATIEARAGRAASKEEWRTVTSERVRHDGGYFYKGLTFQDLNALLAVIRAQAQTQTQPARK